MFFSPPAGGPNCLYSRQDRIGVISGKTLVWAPLGPKVGSLSVFGCFFRFLLINFEMIRAADLNVGPFFKHLARRSQWYHCFWSQGHLKVTKAHFKVIWAIFSSFFDVKLRLARSTDLIFFGAKTR